MKKILGLSFLLAACGGASGGTGAGADAGASDAASAPQDGSVLVTSDGAVIESPDLAKPGPRLALTFSGCSPDLSGNLLVAAGNGSMVVASSSAPADGEVQLHLTETSGTLQLSSAQRVASGDVINVLAGTTWTNAQTGATDPISGTLTINAYDESAGIADLVFGSVVLQNVEDHSLCTVDGTLVTTGTTF